MAVRFDASGDFYTATTGLPPSTTWTTTFWAYIVTDRNAFSGMLTLGGGGEYVYIETTSDGTSLLVASESGPSINPSVNMSVGTWYKIGVVVNGASSAVYVAAQGAALATTTGTLSSPATPSNLYVGADPFGSWFNGRLAGVKIWSAALTAGEVAAEFTQFDPVRRTNLLRYHRFTTATTADNSGNGNALTAGGTATSTEADPVGVPESSGPDARPGQWPAPGRVAPGGRWRAFLGSAELAVSTTATPGVASGTGTAYGATANVTQPAGNAAGTGSAGAITAVYSGLSTLTEDFATTDTSKWFFDAGATVTGGQLGVVPSVAYPAIYSNHVYDLTGSYLIVEMPQAPNLGNGSTQAFMSLVSGTDQLDFLTYNGGVVQAQRVVGGVTTAMTSAAYNSGTHRWFRISESGGTVTWATSSNGASWTTLDTWSVSFGITTLTVNIGAGYYDTEPAPGTALFDNVNLPPASTTATPGAATGTGAAYGATANLVQPAGNAAGTGAAYGATANLVQPAGVATGTGSALGATANLAQPAGNAAGTGTAYNATGSTAESATATPGAATGTGTAYGATANLVQPAGNAAGIGAAYNPTGATAADTTAPAGAATGTGTAYGSTGNLTQPAGLASGTGAAYGATGNLVQPAGAASGTGTAYGVAGQTLGTASALPGTATGTGAAHGVSGNVTQPAGRASGTGQAFGAAGNVTPTAGGAGGSGSAYGATARVIATASGAASGTGAANQPSVQVSAVAGAATGTGTAYQPAIAAVASAEVAAGTGTAYAAGVTSNSAETNTANAGHASGVGNAFRPTIRIVLPATGGNWRDLRSILVSIRQEAANGQRQVACPNDGEPLQTGPNGQPFCPYDGYGAERVGAPVTGGDWGGLAAALEQGAPRRIPVSLDDIRWGPAS